MCGGRYDVEITQDPVFKEPAYVLYDRYTGSSARIIPALGNNLMSFVAGFFGGRQVDVILGAPASESPGRASRWGNPILFPFPNRVRDARYSFAGQSYELPVNTPEGNHIHGLVRDLPWHVDEATARDNGAVLRCSFVSGDHPDIASHYPFPFVLTVTYTLDGVMLQFEAEVRNLGPDPMPMGLGIHPYIRLPLGDAGSRADALVSVPSRMLWEQDEEKLPTGRVIPAPPELDFSAEKPLGEVFIDHVYTEVSRDAAGRAVCIVRDPRNKVEVSVWFGPEFPHVVVLAPADRSTIAFEPYTCVTNAINLAATRADTGLIVLPPGETWRGAVRLAVAELPGE